MFDFEGAPIKVTYRRNLLDTAGNPAHAATFIRERQMILDPELKKNPRRHHRILVHEYLHFAWVRLGNPRRAAWEGFLKAEWDEHVGGEAGWSAEWRKQKLSAQDVAERSRRWRDYCCESFCETGALVSCGAGREVTLAVSRQRARVAWFRRNLGIKLAV
jgi:hypothetical protein